MASPLAPIPDNSDRARVAELEQRLIQLEAQFLTGGSSVGKNVSVSHLFGLSPSALTGLVIVPYGEAGTWAVRNGATVAKADYPALNTLYAADSYPFGSTADTFSLPDSLGKQSTSIDTTGTFATMGATGGQEAITNVPAHAHAAGTLAITPNPHDHTVTVPNAGTNFAAAGDTYGQGNNSTSTGTASLSITGSTDSEGSASVNTLDPYIVDSLPLVRIA